MASTSLKLRFKGFPNELWETLSDSTLREQLARDLDKVLRENNLGKWVGSRLHTGIFEIRVQVNDEQAAMEYILSVIKTNPLLPYLADERDFLSRRNS